MSANFQKIIDKISEAFSFFDFSFLISGSATFAICCYTLNQLGINISSDNMFLNVCISIVGIYIAGLISFALGKKIRVCIADKDGTLFEKIFNETIAFIKNMDTASKNNAYKKDEATEQECYICYFFMYIWKKLKQQKHKLTNCFCPKHSCNKQELKLQYTQMWAYLRDNQNVKESMAFLNRLWVMQAVFEGLMISSATAIVSGAILGIMLSWKQYDVWYMIIGGLISMIACYWEGKRYAETQIKEVVITYYQLKNQI